MGDFVPLQDISGVSSCSARGEKLRRPANGNVEHEDFMVWMERGVSPPPGTVEEGAEPELYGTAITGMVAFSITFLDTLLMALRRRRPRSSRAPIIM
jgi:hypothetical protein